MKKLMLATLLALSLPVQAENIVVMTDGMLVTYDPLVTYVPSGTLESSDIFSIGFSYTNPTYSNTINLSAPADMPGELLWGLSSKINGEGLLIAGGSLTAGESDTIGMGGFPTASVTSPRIEWFSMANFDLPSPIAFGLEVPDSLIGEVTSAPVPEAETWAMMLTGLGLLGLAARRRKVQPVSGG